LRLGDVNPCGFLSRITDLKRLGAGDCSLTQIAYSGYQCRSAKTCNLASTSSYRFGVRPGSSLSQLNQFGVLKTEASVLNCDPAQALTGGENGWLTSHPGSECQVSIDDLTFPQHPFVDCIVDSQGTPIGLFEPPHDPWQEKCQVIDCEEGANCPTEPPTDESSGSSGPEKPQAPPPSQCADNDTPCKVEEWATRNEMALDQALDAWARKACGDCLQSGFQQGVANAIRNLPPIEEHVNADLGAQRLRAGTRWKDSTHTSIEIFRDDAAIEAAAYKRVADRYSISVDACSAIDACLGEQIAQAASDLYYADQHEWVHAIFDGLLESGMVFTTAGEQYFDLYGQSWESIFRDDPKDGCKQGLGANCSAQHELEYELFRILFPDGRGYLDCGIEGACGSACGLHNPAVERSAACRAYVERLQGQYEQRMRGRCPRPRPNVAPSDTECRFDLCFGATTPVTARACPFVLCKGDQAVGDDLACGCCNQCGTAPVPGAGVSDVCGPGVSCNQCCIRCSVPEPTAPCPAPPGALASERPAPFTFANTELASAGSAPLFPQARPPADRDSDGHLDTGDNCLSSPNPAQRDLDGDGIGFGCDPDDEVTGRGTLSNWSDQVAYEMDELAHAHGSGIHIWWSPWDAGTKVWTYARSPYESSNEATDGAQVAATTLTSFAQITDANAFDFTTGAVLVDSGKIAVFRNVITGTYGALRVDAAWHEGDPAAYQYHANMTWIFAGHSSKLSALP
jgi:hypothetical protein